MRRVGFLIFLLYDLTVNPEISSGLPIPAMNRNPAPASRPELYATPATEASDIAFNPVSF
jgi:hypothetical protein